MASREDRAKQFLAFDALKGLQEALREKEIEYEQQLELTEESYMELQNILNKIEIGSNIEIRYYKGKRYITITGVVTKIDCIKKKIQLNETENISLDDIIEININ